jgi:translation initiation factor eIF-2B subunit alpha
MALLAKAHQKPFYALAESYKFLRHFPLSQTDLPNPRSALLHGKPVLPLSFDTSTRTNGHLKADGEHLESPPPGTPLDDSTTGLGSGTGADQGEAGKRTGKGEGTGTGTGTGTGVGSGNASGKRGKERHMTQDMLDLNPEVDVTMPALIDYVITDLGSPLSPTSVSQYIVAQFAT